MASSTTSGNRESALTSPFSASSRAVWGSAAPSRGIKAGGYREATPDEMQALLKAVKLDTPDAGKSASPGAPDRHYPTRAPKRDRDEPETAPRRKAPGERTTGRKTADERTARPHTGKPSASAPGQQRKRSPDRKAADDGAPRGKPFKAKPGASRPSFPSSGKGRSGKPSR